MGSCYTSLGLHGELKREIYFEWSYIAIPVHLLHNHECGTIFDPVPFFEIYAPKHNSEDYNLQPHVDVQHCLCLVWISSQYIVLHYTLCRSSWPSVTYCLTKLLCVSHLMWISRYICDCAAFESCFVLLVLRFLQMQYEWRKGSVILLLLDYHTSVHVK